MRVAGRDTRESKLDARLHELAGKGDWKGVVRALDRYDENNERRHRSHRDDLDITIPERKADDKQDTYRISDMMRLCCWKDWVDIIFSQMPEDLHHLVEDTKVKRTDATAEEDLAGKSDLGVLHKGDRQGRGMLGAKHHQAPSKGIRAGAADHYIEKSRTLL